MLTKAGYDSGLRCRLKILIFILNMSDRFELEEKIVEVLRTVYDPEIQVNIYDLGLIYGVDVDDDSNVTVTMTLTAPGCSLADFIVEDVRQRVEGIAEVKSVVVNLVFEPEWNKDMMSEEARLELGFE